MKHSSTICDHQVGAADKQDGLGSKGKQFVPSSTETGRMTFTVFNLLTPNDPYSGRTAPLTSKVAFYIFIEQI